MIIDSGLLFWATVYTHPVEPRDRCNVRNI